MVAAAGLAGIERPLDFQLLPAPHTPSPLDRAALEALPPMEHLAVILYFRPLPLLAVAVVEALVLLGLMAGLAVVELVKTALQKLLPEPEQRVKETTAGQGDR